MRHTLSIFALVGLFAFASQAASISSNTVASFNQFIIDHGKKYATSEEHAKRLRIFADNVMEIERHNNMANGGAKSWKKGINKFSDLTAEEFKSTYTGGYVNHFKRDSNAKVEVSMEGLPESVDWREKGAVTAVKDQGQCGSCWAHAAVQQLESYLFLSGNDDLLELSAQHITSCTPNPNHCGGTGGCSGSIATLGYVYAQFYGVALEKDYPYTSGQTSQTGECNFDAENQDSAVYTKGYETLPHNDYEALLHHVANVGPIAVSADASKWGSYSSGVFDGCSYDENIEVNHAIQLVGYGTDPEEGDYWLVRNSWGTNWGEDGYIRLKRESKQTCGEDNTPLMGSACEGDGATVQKACGMCGIAFDSDYPIGVDKVSGLEP